MRRVKKIPTFSRADEAKERAFWEATDSTQYVDWSQARNVRFPNLRPSTATISLRLPQGMLDDLKSLANARDVPYQSLLKIFLAERLAAERGRRTS
jgi:predicted DNA binding CopG/RHH family protein